MNDHATPTAEFEAGTTAPSRINDGRPPHDAPSDIFFAAVKTTRMPMVVTDPHQPDNPIIFCNDAFSFMTGYAEHEIVGSNCRFLQGPETDRDTVRDIAQAIERQQETSVEIINYKKNGSAFWNALFISPVRDKAGKLLYFFGSQLDVSRRRDAEDALRQAQKMEALGQLTGGIAHDFNNLLQVVTGYLEVIASGIEKETIDRDRLGRARVTRAETRVEEAVRGRACRGDCGDDVAHHGRAGHAGRQVAVRGNVVERQRQCG